MYLNATYTLALEFHTYFSSNFNHITQAGVAAGMLLTYFISVYPKKW